MNEYDDLFQHEPLFTPPKAPVPEVDDWNEILSEQKTNRWLITLYFLVQVVFVFVIMMVNSLTYPEPQTLYDNVETVNPIVFTIEDSDDIEYPYLVTIDGSFISHNTNNIPMLILSIEFYYQDEYIDYVDVQAESLKPETLFSFQESYYFSTPVDKITYTYTFDLDSNAQMILNISQSFLLASLFLFIDRSNFKKRWKEFKNNSGENIGKIVLGLAMVYMASIIGQGIVNALGGSTSSANETAIASLFTADPLRLFLLFMMLCVLAPITEEVIYRKVIFGWLDKRWGAVSAILISGAIFGLMHVISYGDFIQAIPYVLMGGTFGYLYHWSRKNIYVTLSVHFLNNLIAYAMYFLMILGFIAE